MGLHLSEKSPWSRLYYRQGQRKNCYFKESIISLLLIVAWPLNLLESHISGSGIL